MVAKNLNIYNVNASLLTNQSTESTDWDSCINDRKSSYREVVSLLHSVQAVIQLKRVVN